MSESEDEIYVNMLSFFQEHGDILLKSYRFNEKYFHNNIFNFKLPQDKFNVDWNYSCPLSTQCRLTTDFMTTCFADKPFDSYNISIKSDRVTPFDELMFKDIIQENSNFLVTVSIPSSKGFPGHILSFIVHRKNIYCIQSFIFEYTPKYKKLSETQFENYLRIFTGGFKKSNAQVDSVGYEISTWTQYDNAYTNILTKRNYNINVNIDELTDEIDALNMYLKYLSIGYGLFSVFKYFVRNLFNIGNKTCGCIFLKNGKFEKLTASCKEVSIIDLNAHIYNTYNTKYKYLKGTKDHKHNMFKLFKYIEVLFKTDDPMNFKDDIEESFGNKILDVNSSTCLSNIEDYIFRYENSIFQPLKSIINSEQTNTTTYFIYIFLYLLHKLYLQRDFASSPIYNLNISWLKDISPTQDNKNLEIFEIFSVAIILLSSHYSDIKELLSSVVNNKLEDYLLFLDTDDEQIKQNIQYFRDYYITNNKFKQWIRDFSNKSLNFKQTTYDDLLDLYFINCSNTTGDNPDIFGSTILSNLENKYHSNPFYLIYFLTAIEISHNVSYGEYIIVRDIDFNSLIVSITPKKL